MNMGLLAVDPCAYRGMLKGVPLFLYYFYNYYKKA